MAHVRVETSVPRHRKFLAAGPAASWLWLAGCCYCNEQRVDVLPARAIALLGVPVQGRSRLVRALEEAGLWIKVPAGWRVVVPTPDRPKRTSIRHLFRRLVALWGDTCAYCGECAGEALEVEHLVPVARGGGNEIQNLALACRACNRRKNTKTASEFGFPHVSERARCH